MRLLLSLVTFLLPAPARSWLTGTTSGLQLKIGSRIPELSGVDQFGMQQKIESLKILETHSDLQNLETVQTRLSKITLCRT